MVLILYRAHNYVLPTFQFQLTGRDTHGGRIDMPPSIISRIYNALNNGRSGGHDVYASLPFPLVEACQSTRWCSCQQNLPTQRRKANTPLIATTPMAHVAPQIPWCTSMTWMASSVPTSSLTTRCVLQ